MNEWMCDKCKYKDVSVDSYPCEACYGGSLYEPAEGTVITMMSLEQAIAQYEQFANVCEHHGLTASQEEFEQLTAWLRELQERKKEQYLTIEQIAAAVGTQTIHSAYHWFEFARTLEILGYAVVKRRTDADD